MNLIPKLDFYDIYLLRGFKKIDKYLTELFCESCWLAIHWFVATEEINYSARARESEMCLYTSPLFDASSPQKDCSTPVSVSDSMTESVKVYPGN